MNYKESWKTEKSMNKWAKGMRNKLEGRYLDLFNQQLSTMRKANDYTKATFVMYWAIQTQDPLSEYAVYITQATLMSMTDKYLQLNKMQEANAIHQMNVNFARLIGGLDNEEE